VIFNISFQADAVITLTSYDSPLVFSSLIPHGFKNLESHKIAVLKKFLEAASANLNEFPNPLGMTIFC
jgi:hypothetical protein